MSKRLKRNVVANFTEQEERLKQRHRISFSFGLLHDASFSECRDAQFFVEMLQRMKKLCVLEWRDINTSHRHSFGYEKIPVKSIRPDINLSMELDFLWSFRATGSNHVFLGFRDGDVFEVVFIESKFGDIYSHGK